uniref:Uncharacterized protein n=1 Tax=Bionectria ochroleuca TaxID=29856 RepID=A0A8H7NBQ4_BIOOC
MFAGGHGLFELIPYISVLFSQRLAEEAGVLHPLMEEYDDKLNNWVMDDEHNLEEGSDQKKHYYQAMSNEFLRNSIHICLLAAIQALLFQTQALWPPSRTA